MTSPRRVLLITSAAALALAGCDIGDDGPRATQTRDVPDFTRIDSRDSVDVELRVGEPQRVRVRAGEKVIDDVRTEVRDGTLRLTVDGDSYDDVVVVASVPELTGVDVTGSADVEADGIDADAFDVGLHGSGDIALHGSAGRLAVEVDGSGDADLGELAAREARVSVDGSADVDVRADARLDIDIDGSADVRYHGDPALTQRIDGSGELTRAG